MRLIGGVVFVDIEMLEMDIFLSAIPTGNFFKFQPFCYANYVLDFFFITQAG